MTPPAQTVRRLRTDGPCPECKRPKTCAYYSDGSEHCYGAGCNYHKYPDETLNKGGKRRIPLRKKPRESLEALEEFEALRPANAKQSYLTSKHHKGDITLPTLNSDVRQEGSILVVPMQDAQGKLKNLQRIFPDGHKLNLPGLTTKGLFHPIGNGNTARVFIVEGWATGISMHCATGDDVLVAFGCSNLANVAEYAKGRYKTVVICADTDQRAALLAEEIAADIGGQLFVPDFPDGVKGTDANDLAQKLGIKELRKQVEKDTRRIPPPPDLVEVAAGLSRKEYRESKVMFAEALGISVRQLDTEVRECRQEITFEEPEPWPEPVDGIELVENIQKIIAKYVSLPDFAVTAVTLWVIMTYFADDEDLYIAALLACLSPTKRCGKSTLLKVLKRLVYRPHVSSNSTPATIFRMIDEYQPTFLIDEFDSFKDINPELRGILNSGHDRDMAYIDRCVGDDNNPRRFSTFGPKAVAAIGKIPATLEDRAIIIDMRRKLVEDKKKRLRRPRQGDAFDKLRRQIARLVKDDGEGLCKAHIRFVKGLNDRQFDNWMPLLQIAKRIGGRDYQEKVAALAVKLSSKEEGEEDSSAGVLLLQDLQQLFKDEKADRLGTAFILNALEKMDDGPWPEYRRGKPITARQLAELLKPFGIRPRQKRSSKKDRKQNPKRGYVLRNCTDAFSRYL